MKCEICHKADATEAIVRGDNEDDEIYVCSACAKAEKTASQRKSHRTRKITGLPPGISMSVTEISRTNDGETSEKDVTEDPPPFIGAIMDVFKDMVGGIRDVVESVEKQRKAYNELVEFPTDRVEAPYRMKGALHLEGLHLIGELEPVKRAINALKMDIGGVVADGVKDAGHCYTLSYNGSSERAKRVIEDILLQEKNARKRLKRELKRIYSDAVCRALALIKNCRLLSSGELFDLLSPLRLAAQMKLLDGITLAKIERLMSEQDLSNSADRLSQEERDRIDAERADEMNRLFEEVVFDDVL